MKKKFFNKIILINKESLNYISYNKKIKENIYD